MSKRPTLTDVTSLTNSSAINTLNQNWDAIQESFDNTLSLDGSTPNAMNADLDLNGNALLNVGTIDVTNLTLDGQTVTDLATVPEWRGAWVTATAYAKNDLVKTAGNVYICLVAHTSAAAFSTDLTAVRWELMVTKGDSGAGSGDMVSTNNLSDVSDIAAARANLSLGTVATENTVPVAKGGTGATDAATARTNLGLGSLATLSSVTTTQIAAATLVTEADTIASNDNDTTIPTSAAVKAYADSVGGSGTVAAASVSSGTAVDFTVPSTANRIEILFMSVSLSGSDSLLIQLGDAGGIETTGYIATGNTTDSTSGFPIAVGNAARAVSGVMSLTRVDTTEEWVSSHSAALIGLNASGGGYKTLSAAITTIRITRTGTDTFDGSGRVAIRYWS